MQMQCVVDDFVLVKSIGKGNFGEVFLTQRKGYPQLYATKKMERSVCERPPLLNRLINEIKILQYVNHPNIVKFIDLKKSMNNWYLVTEYVNGGSLTSNLKKYMAMYRRPFTEDIVQHIMRQIVSAIQYLHHNKILHRDLKSDNILLHFESEEDKQNFNLLKSQVKVIDFGFARYLENEGLAQSILGSPINMDPQILAKMRKIDNNQSFGYDQKADIWSLGTVCYEILIGTPPFDANSYDDLVNKIKSGNYKIPSDLNLSREAISFINGMLQYDPKERLNIDQLANHNFLKKDVRDFSPVNLKGYQNTKDIILNTKEKNSVWGIFESTVKDLNTIIDKPQAQQYKGVSKGITGEVVDTISQLTQGITNLTVAENINNNNSYKKQDSKNVSSVDKNISSEIKKNSLKIFDELNLDYYFLEPMLIPIEPIVENKPLELDF